MNLNYNITCFSFQDLPRIHGDEPTKLIAAYQLAKSAPYAQG